MAEDNHPGDQESSPIQNINDIFAAAQTANNKFNRANAWWRGHSQCDWKLTPEIHRRKYNERSMYVDFFRRAKTRHQNYPPDADLAGWLFLMQHYRLPTRLLDWSMSILVALFFALEKDNFDVPGALWALEPVRLNHHLCEQANILGTQNTKVLPMFNEPFGGQKSPYPAAALMTQEIDIRMLVQLATCTIHTTSTPLEELSGNKEFLIKFILAKEKKRELLGALDLLGVTLSSMFPDLEHLAKEIKSLTYIKPE